MQDKIRLGVVGTGLIWENVHMPCMRNTNRFEVGALCARGIENQVKWAAEFPKAEIFGDYETLLKKADVDVILVATPISLNPVVSVKAMQAGKDVFEEKPIATTFDQAENVVKTMSSTGKKLIMLEQQLYDPRYLYIKKLIDEKTIGEPVLFEMLTHFILDPKLGGYSKTWWRMNPDFPLGAIFDGGAHDFAVLSYLFGIPKKLYSTGEKLRECMGEYDHILTCFTFEKMSGFHSHSAFLGCDKNYFNIRFTEGAVYVEDDKLVIEKREGGKETVSFEPENPYQRMWNHLAGVYNGLEAPLFTAEMAADSVRMFDAITKSISIGESVSL